MKTKKTHLALIFASLLLIPIATQAGYFPPLIHFVQHSPTTPNADQNVIASCLVTDDGTITSVHLYVIINGNWLAVYPDPIHVGDGFYQGTITNLDAGDFVEYYFEANDNDGEQTTSVTNSFTVSPAPPDPDTEDPVISMIAHSPSNPSSVDTVTFTAIVFDNDAVATVTLQIKSSGLMGFWVPYTMNEGSPSEWTAYVSYLEPDVMIDYKVSAIDLSGNLATSSIASFYVTDGSEVVPPPDDTEDPVISLVVHNPTNPHTIDMVTFTAIISDNDAVATVTLHLKTGIFGSWTYHNMIEETSDNWVFYKEGFEAGKTIYYKIYALDYAGNLATTSTTTFDVLEEDETSTPTEPTDPTDPTDPTYPTDPREPNIVKTTVIPRNSAIIVIASGVVIFGGLLTLTYFRRK